MPYEKLENDATTSIPKISSLRVFRGISEEATFEDGEDSDGEIGPLLDTVENEQHMDEALDEQPLLADKGGIASNINATPLPPDLLHQMNLENEGY